MASLTITSIASGVEPVQQGQRVGVPEPGEVETTPRSIARNAVGVAVALQHLEQRVGDRAVGVEGRALAVGDDRGEPAAGRRRRRAGRRGRGDQLGRHQHALAVAQPGHRQPLQRPVVGVVAARLQAQGARVRDPVGALAARPARRRTPAPARRAGARGSTAPSRPSRRARRCGPPRGWRRSRARSRRGLGRRREDALCSGTSSTSRPSIANSSTLRWGRRRGSAATASRRSWSQLLQGDGAGVRRPASSRCTRCTTWSVGDAGTHLERRRDRVELQGADDGEVVAQLAVGERDLRVEGLVRAQPDRAAVGVEVDLQRSPQNRTRRRRSWSTECPGKWPPVRYRVRSGAAPGRRRPAR